jgi:cyanate lyase
MEIGTMTREELTANVPSILKKKGLTYKGFADKIGMSPIYATAALMGQMALPKDKAEKAANVLGLNEAGDLLAQIPYRGSLPTAVPTDPLVYRFYELVQVYGTTFKALIEEEFGDGIMSAIDYDMAIERQPDPNGDRVKITMSGKFLKYKKY